MGVKTKKVDTVMKTYEKSVKVVEKSDKKSKKEKKTKKEVSEAVTEAPTEVKDEIEDAEDLEEFEESSAEDSGSEDVSGESPEEVNSADSVEKGGEDVEMAGENAEAEGDATEEHNWPFEAAFLDHFETPEIAYKDLKSILDFHIKLTHNKLLKKEDDIVQIYDPYFCQGKAKEYMERALNETVEGEGEDKTDEEKKKEGERKKATQKTSRKDDPCIPSNPNIVPVRVHNENRDFYADIESGKIPKYDILVTNPPFSGDHKQKLFEWVLQQIKKEDEDSASISSSSSSSNKSKKNTNDDEEEKTTRKPRGIQQRPFAFLLPSWTTEKAFYREFLVKLAEIQQDRKAKKKAEKNAKTGETLTEGEKKTFDQYDTTLERKAEVFYIAPREKYQFEHLEHGISMDSKGKNLAPFYGIWICGNFKNYQGYVDKFSPKKIILDQDGLIKKRLARSPADIKKRQTENPNQKWRKEVFGKSKGKGKKGSDGVRKDLDKVKSKGKGDSKGNGKKGDGKKGGSKGQGKKGEGCGGKAIKGPSDATKDAAKPEKKEDCPKVEKKKIDAPCRHFFSEVGCARGAGCRFSHVKNE